MKLLNKEQAEKVFNMLQEQLEQLKPFNSVAISQVVVFDEATKLAGTADLVIIDEFGRIQIVDLKTSKSSINDMFSETIKKNNISQKISGKRYELKEYDLDEDTFVLDKNGNPVLDADGNPTIKFLGSDLRKFYGIKKLSTRGQHNLQVNLYRRMFENMGYQINKDDDGAVTFHIRADITGKGKDQVFNGTFNFDGKVKHPLRIDHLISENLLYVDMLVPSIEVLDKSIYAAEDAIYRGSEDIEAMEQLADTVEAQQYSEYNTITTALENYALALVEQDKALDKLKNNVFRDKTKEQTRDDIASTLAYIASNINTGPIARSQTYTNLLRSSLNEMQKFTKYVEDPANVNKPEYITYVLNFNRFLSTFEPLYSIKDSKELNATQRTLVL